MPYAPRADPVRGNATYLDFFCGSEVDFRPGGGASDERRTKWLPDDDPRLFPRDLAQIDNTEKSE